MKIINIIIVSIFFVLSGCTSNVSKHESRFEKIKDEARLNTGRSQTFIREVDYSDFASHDKITYVGSLSLVESLRKLGAGINILPRDEAVDLNKKINVHSNGLDVSDFIDYLSGITGYEIKLHGNTVEVSSFIVKEWNVAPLAMHRNVSLKVGTTLDGSAKENSKLQDNKIESNYTEDDWEKLVEGARAILATEAVSNEASYIQSGDKNKKPFVQAIRSMGLIIAGGAPNKVKVIDQFISGMLVSSTQQINISVKAYDVSLNDQKSTGIDWTKLDYTIKKSQKENSSLDFSTKNNTIINADTSIFKLGFNFGNEDFSAQSILNFLSTYGEVELINQPNVTVRNGSYAYIHTGDELGYVAEVSLVASQNTAPIQTPKIDRLRVGVTLAVAPRVLSDGRILLDIWPVISSLSGFDELAGVNLTSPRVALQELSTQVITRSGETVQLGGFIRKSIGKSLQDLPWRHKITGKILKPFFQSENNGLDRRELVLMVTPAIIDSGKK